MAEPLALGRVLESVCLAVQLGCGAPSPSVVDGEPVSIGPGGAAEVRRTKVIRRGNPIRKLAEELARR